MILLAGLGYRDSALLSNEFVHPVGRVVKRFGDAWMYRHFTDLSGDQAGDYDAVILCGTALKDTRCLGETERFSWLRVARVPVLGISAGMQVLSLAFGGSLLPCCEIGMEEVRVHPRTPFSPPPLRSWPMNSTRTRQSRPRTGSLLRSRRTASRRFPTRSSPSSGSYSIPR